MNTIHTLTNIWSHKIQMEIVWHLSQAVTRAKIVKWR
jgi:hypothetical protein